MTAPTNDELLAVLSPAYAEEGIERLERAPYRYATSHPLEELRVHLTTGVVSVLFKDLGWDRLLPEAAAGRPRFLHQPRREIDTYRAILRRTGVGPRCHAASSHPDRPWLFLEQVPGVELWQIGEPGTWDTVAGWLATFHDRFPVDAVRSTNPHLLDRNAGDFDRWRRRAIAALERSADPRAADLRRRLRDGVARPVGAPTFLHGELYPANVLVSAGAGRVRVCPVDWEMAATGPPAFDLAALVTGWDETARRRLVERYRAARHPSPDAEELRLDLESCRLHLALQWLGWAPGWRAPDEHAHDWIGEAVDASERLGW